MKLAFADREAYYGDPDFVKVPIETLLSDAYSAERRKLIGDTGVDGTAPRPRRRVTSSRSSARSRRCANSRRQTAR